MRAAAYALLAALLLITFLAGSPALGINPGRDSGGFLYAADVILDGGVVYRDVWDHKPPAIYFIDALGLLIGDRSIWGVWALELLFAAIAITAIVAVTRRYGFVESIGAGTMIACGLFALSRSDNYAEEYAAAAQCIGIWMWRGRPLRELSALTLVGIAATGVVAFLLKPPLAGVWMVMVAFWLMRPRDAARLVIPAAAALAMLGAVALAYASAGALDDLVEQVFHYNAAYVKFVTIADRLDAARHGLWLMMTGFYGVIALLALAGFAATRFRTADVLVRFAAVDLVLELLFAAMPGRLYDHYFIAMLPAIAILTAAGLARVRVPLRVAAIAVAGALTAFASVRIIANPPRTRHSVQRDEAVAFLRQHTRPEDPVLMWGAEAGVNFLADRRAPVRFAFVYPLMTTGYPLDVRSFIGDLERNPPAVIIDASATNPRVPPLDRDRLARWRPASPSYVPPRELTTIIDWIHAHYRPAGFFPTGRWVVYVPRS